MSAIIVLVLRIFMAVVLYVFVAFAFYLLWRSLRKPATTHKDKVIPILILKPSDNPDGEAHNSTSPK